jgi:hypothetical protein
MARTGPIVTNLCAAATDIASTLPMSLPRSM